MGPTRHRGVPLPGRRRLGPNCRECRAGAADFDGRIRVSLLPPFDPRSRRERSGGGFRNLGERIRDLALLRSRRDELHLGRAAVHVGGVRKGGPDSRPPHPDSSRGRSSPCHRARRTVRPGAVGPGQPPVPARTSSAAPHVGHQVRPPEPLSNQARDPLRLGILPAEPKGQSGAGHRGPPDPAGRRRGRDSWPTGLPAGGGRSGHPRSRRRFREVRGQRGARKSSRPSETGFSRAPPRRPFAPGFRVRLRREASRWSSISSSSAGRRSRAEKRGWRFSFRGSRGLLPHPTAGEEEADRPKRRKAAISYRAAQMPGADRTRGSRPDDGQ